jgi:hypothetical protein
MKIKFNGIGNKAIRYTGIRYMVIRKGFNPYIHIPIYHIPTLLLLVLLLTIGQTNAQSKVGTTIGQFLKIDPSARAASMGNASTSVSGEVSSVFYNPASLGRIRGIDFQFTHNQWIADINYNYAAVGIAVPGFGSLSLQVTSLNSGEIDVRTVELPQGTGERYSVSNFALGLGYGLMLTDRVSVGFLINYYNETIWHSSLSSFAMSIGVQYQVAVNSLTIGASLSNFGPRTGYDGRDLYIDYDYDPGKYGDNDQIPSELRTSTYALPTLFRVGASFPVHISESNVVIISADALHPNDNEEKVNAGLEWRFFDYFALRGGYRDLLLTDSEGGLTLGAGVNVSYADNYNVRFDYAWADYGRLNDSHRFTLSLGF